MRPKNSKLLSSLTTAALAIPGLAMQGNAEVNQKNNNQSQELTVSPFGEITSDLKYSYLREDSLKKPVIRDPRGYRIDVWQALFVVPYKNLDLTANLQRDAQSGPSSGGPAPLITTDLSAAANVVVDGRTNATINEVRDQVSLSADYNLENSKYGATVYYSTENDYLSKAIGLKGQWDFNKNNTVLLAATSIARDNIRPSQGGIPGLQEIHGNKTTQKYYLGLKQDLTKYNYLQLSVEYEYNRGHLDDPYKVNHLYGQDTAGLLRDGAVFLPGIFFAGKAPAGISIASERRPTTRRIWSPMLRFVTYIPYTEASLHFDYRYSNSSWDTDSHTFELSYFQPFCTKWEFAPRIRYYSQNRASFYAPIFNLTSGPAPFLSQRLTTTRYSSDYRLGGFGTLTFEARLTYQMFEKAAIGLVGGYYRREAGYKMGSKDPIPHPTNKGLGMKYASIDFRFKF